MIIYLFILFIFQDGLVTTEEFKKAVQNSCIGRSYNDFPQAMKLFIDSHFKILDINGIVVIFTNVGNFVNK